MDMSKQIFWMIKNSVIGFCAWTTVAQSVVSDYKLDERGSIPGRGKGVFL
jgi:hypothetical protein